MQTIKLNNKKLFEIVYYTILIINSIENNSYIFINDYIIELLKLIKDPSNTLLKLEYNDLKKECIKIVNTIIYDQ